MAFSKTLVCVHAHPDDEAIFTSGISAHYAALGYSVVLVTCTNGRLGFDEHNRPGNEAGHDGGATTATRAAELQRSASLVGFTRLVTLGFEDSGMVGWPQNEDPRAFMNIDVDAVARTLAALFDEVGATVVVTYDENGFYGHPDHIMANVVTRRALDVARSPQRLYYPVVPRGSIKNFVERAEAQGVVLPAFILEADFGIADELVASTMDVNQYVGLKQEALRTHASQTDNADLVTMEPDVFALMFGTEWFQRAWSRGESTGDATDLFGGL
jgi:LmbE family N-acetylglucosaminyl deacetylase